MAAKAELEERKDQLETQVDEAGEKAKQEAENKGLSAEDVTKLVEKARKEEKDKLYPQIDALTKGIKELQDAMREQQDEKKRIEKETKDKAEAERKAKLSETERTAEILGRLEERLEREQKSREEFEQKLAERDRRDALRRHRENLLKGTPTEYSEYLYEDTVQGNSVAELDDAYVRAEARAKEIAERIKAAQGDKVRRGMPRTTNPDLSAQEEQELDESLQHIDQDRYLKDPAYKAKIQQALADEYARAAGH